VSTVFMTTEFDDVDTATTFGATPYASVKEALCEAGVVGKLANSGEIDTARLQPLVAPAVDAARVLMENVSSSQRSDIERRVSEWGERVEAWQNDASALSQIAGLRRQRDTISEERRIAESMRPQQMLVRPLLIVVPREGEF